MLAQADLRQLSWAGPRASRQSQSRLRCAGTSTHQQPALVQGIGTASLRHNCTAQGLSKSLGYHLRERSAPLGSRVSAVMTSCAVRSRVSPGHVR